MAQYRASRRELLTKPYWIRSQMLSALSCDAGGLTKYMNDGGTAG